MDDTRWERLAALGGFAFVVLAVVGTFLPGAPPAADDTAKKIGDYFRDHSGGIKAGQVLTGLALIALSWWFGSLWRMMRRAEDDRPRLAVVALFGLAFSGVFALLSGAISSAVALRIDDLGDGGALTFYTLSSVVIATSAFGSVVFIAAVSALNWRTRFLPAWITYLGWLSAALFLVASFASASDSGALAMFGMFGFLTWAVWIIGISARMWRGSSAGVTRAASGAPVAAPG